MLDDHNNETHNKQLHVRMLGSSSAARGFTLAPGVLPLPSGAPQMVICSLLGWRLTIDVVRLASPCVGAGGLVLRRSVAVST